MRKQNRCSLLLSVVACGFAGCGGTTDGRKAAEPTPVKGAAISGKARLRNQLSHEGLIVTALGPSTGAAAVDKDGAYSIEGLLAGTYAVTAGARSTLEGFVQIVVSVKEREIASAPDLLLTPTGTVEGKALLKPESGNSAGITVHVDGAPAVSLTAQDGSYRLERVPVGRHTIYASKAGYSFGASVVQVEYDKVAVAAEASLERGSIDSATASISGTARYFNRTSHAGIKIAIEHSSVSATTDADGNYLLKGVPLGYLTLVASAEPYQPSRLENVLSLGSGNFRAPELKLFLGQQRFPGTAQPGTLRLSPDGRFALFMGTPPGGSTQLYLFDADKQGAPRAIDQRATSIPSVSFSSDGKFAAYSLQGVLSLINLEGGAIHKLAEGLQATDAFAFSPDGKGFAFVGAAEPPNNARPLQLVTLASLQASRVDDNVKPTLSTAASCGSNWGGTQPFKFSPDGQALAYVGLTVTGTPETRIHRNGNSSSLSGDASCLVFTADSQRLVWLQRNAASYTYEAWTADATVKPVLLASASSSSYLMLTADAAFVIVQTYGSYYSGSDFTAYPVAGGQANPFLKKATLHKQAPMGSAMLAYDPSTATYFVADPRSVSRVPLAVGASPSYAAFSPRAGFLVYPVSKASYTYANAFLNLATGANVTVGPAQYPNYGTTFVFAPSESAYAYVTDKNELAVAETATGTSIRVGTGTAVAFSPSGTHLVYRGSDGILRVFDVAGRADRALNVRSSGSMRLSPDGSRLAVTDDKKDLYAVVLAGGEPLLIDNQVDQVVEADSIGRKLLYVVSTPSRSGLYFAQVP